MEKVTRLNWMVRDKERTGSKVAVRYSSAIINKNGKSEGRSRF